MSTAKKWADEDRSRKALDLWGTDRQRMADVSIADEKPDWNPLK
jgi:hypothetical protein